MYDDGEAEGAKVAPPLAVVPEKRSEQLFTGVTCGTTHLEMHARQ
jgi:hypothetical protein